MPQARANNIDIEYEEFGASSDPTILLIMGLGMQLIAWPEDFCRDLAARGFRVIRYDNRDTGVSTKFEGRQAPSLLSMFLRSALRWPIPAPYSLTDMADDAAGLLDAVGVKTAHVVGASMGGMIAQNLAVKHPNRVRTLTSIMSTSGHRSLPGADPMVAQHVFRARPSSLERTAVIAHTMRTIELIGSPAYPVDEDKRREMASMSYDRCFYPPGFARHVAAIFQDGCRRSRLRRIRVPTLVVHGREDPLVPLAGGIDTAEHIDGARLEIIDGMGHNLPIELWPRIIDLVDGHSRLAAPASGRA